MRFRGFLLLLLCTTAMCAWSQAPEGSKLSSAIEQLLTENEIQHERHILALTSQDLFPYNIEIAFPAQKEAEQPEAFAAEGRTSLIIDIAQEDVYLHKDAFIDFLQYINAQEYAFDVLVLLTTQTTAPKGLSQTMTGSAVYARELDATNSTAAVTMRFANRRAIYTGSEKRTSPRWLTAAACTAFFQAETPYRYPHFVASFYRLGLVRDRQPLDAFMQQGIPAISLTLQEAQDVTVLKRLCDAYNPADTGLWDSHYLLIPLTYPFKAVFVGERTFVLGAIILGTLVVLVLCMFSFVGAGSEQHKRQLRRVWFMIPLTVVISFLSILFGQFVCMHIPLILTAPPLLQISLKVIVSGIAISVIFIMQEALKVPVGQFVYGYIILLIAIGNIFLFAAIDLQFFLPLLAEYLIIYATRRSIELTPLIVTVLLMVLPFTPYIYTLMRAGATESIEQLIFCSPKQNILLALLFFPFQVMWLRMLLLFKLYRNANKAVIKRLFAHNALPLSLLVAVLGTLTITLNVVARKIEQEPEEKAVLADKAPEEKDALTVATSRTSFTDLTTEHILITSQEQAVRYEVKLTSSEGIPLYDSSYDFVINESTRTARFTLPDFPPQRMTIDYAYPAKSDALITVTALYRTDEPLVYRREVKTVNVTAEAQK